VTLQADINVNIGSLALTCGFDAPGARTTALLGPNGAGKTTVLRVLAGLIRIEQGRVTLEGDVLEDTERGTWVSPDARRVGVMFQDHALFPHLTLLDNVAFGLRARGLSRVDARGSARDWLERLGLGARAGSRPRTLSGGESQRVALARALVTAPRLLLLDEPTASADPAAKTELRRTLREHMENFPGVRILVTHDPVEAAALADSVVIIEKGRVVQTGTVGDVTARPRSAWVASMAGLNLLRGTLSGGTLKLTNGAELAVAATQSGDVLATVHPRAIALYRDAPSGSPRNVLRSTVVSLDPEGERSRVSLDSPIPLIAELTTLAAAELRLADGGEVFAVIKATEIDVYAM
jgi:molybdate transport system ATP-binding protein